MDYQVRDARITDVDRIMNLLDGSAREFSGPVGIDEVANLLRQLVYLPQAAVIVADAGRRIIGIVVLALRPSIREGGMVGNIDVLTVEPGYERAGVAEALVNEAIRSARNKGCRLVEASQPVDRSTLERWLELGFEEGDARIVRAVAQPTAARN